VHEGKGCGVLVDQEGKGTLEKNKIWGNAYSGVEIRRGAAPTLRQNVVTKNKEDGIYVHDGGGGIFENNDLRGKRSAWNIDASSQKIVKKSDNIEK
jgi:parallel beta-helix repeat protein